MQSYLQAALVCIDGFYARMFRDWPDAVTQQTESITLSFSGDTRLTGANHLWPRTPDAITALALHQAQAFFHRYQAAWSVLYTDSYMSGASDLLRDHDYYPRWNSPVMVLDALPNDLPPRRDTPVLRATTIQHLADIEVIMSEAFATGTAVNRRVVRPDHLPDPTISHYVAYAGQEPATCATVVICGEMAGIWNVGTRYKFRRQRYATTIMFAVLDDLRARGYPVTMLMASPNGQPLYERLGYRHIATTYYMGPPYFMRSSWSG
jgi:hypothetical protein